MCGKSGDTTKLSRFGHLLMEDRHGLVVDAQVSQVKGTVEREAGIGRVEVLPGTHRVTMGADKNHDTKSFVAALQRADVIPHVA